jgi:Mg2+-importing ATPase
VLSGSRAPGAIAAGLGSVEAAARLRDVGPNLIDTRPSRAVVLQFLARFRNPLILLLLAAGGISAATGDRASFVIIAVMVLLSVTLDFVQEYRAERSAERLRESVAMRATAVRDGEPASIPARDLVPGDVVLLSPGDLVPADGRLLEATHLFVNQALLTGEPYPVGKRVDAEQASAGGPGDVFMGTSVVSGTARALVCRTGPRTELGRIGASLEARRPPTAFETGTRNFGLLILRLAILMVLFVILVNGIRHRPRLETFLFAVALAVGLAPELLPMVVSVTLARGALRLAASKVIVKRLASIHDLGSMDILCTDKTGTLTEARIRLDRHVDARGCDSARVLELAYLNSFFTAGLKGPLDEAVLRHEALDVRGWEKLDEIPFDFERRRLSVLLAKPGGGRLLVVKGALEDVLRLSSRREGDAPARVVDLDEAGRREILERFEALGREGYRVLGVAWKALADDCAHAVAADESELVFAGYAVFEDPPKTSAASALRRLAASGVTLKVVTGDNELVSRHLCAELGLPPGGVLTGADIERMDDHALAARAEAATIFCRVTPAQKSRVILALRRRGHVVGYLGDGINDAPSLHAADVGISVDDAVDVAREAADLILLEPDLGVLASGVLEGRRTLGNIMKYVLMGTSSNFGNMMSMAASSVVLPFLPMLPVQILVNNFLYDVSEVPIPMDEVDAEYIERPHRWDMGFIRTFMLIIGPVSSLFDFLTFSLLLGVLGAGEALFHTGWFIESLATQVLVIFVIRTRGNPFRSRPSRVLAVTALAVVATAVALPFTALGGRLGFVAPPPAFFGLLVGLVAVYLAAVEAVKRWFYRRLDGPRRR